MRIYRQKILHIVGVLLFFALVTWFVYTVRSVLTPFILGFLIAYILHPLVDMLERKKISRTSAVAIIYIFLITLVAVLVFYGLPIIIRDLNRLVELIPQYTVIIQEMVSDFQVGYSQVPIPDSIREVMDQVITNLEETVLGIIQGFANGIIGLFSQTFNLVLAPLLSFYFLLDYKRLGLGVLSLVPSRYRPELVRIGGEVNQVIKNVIRGNLLVASLVAVLATLGMMVIGMDFPLLIGIMVGITNFIPYFGAIISAVPAIMLALLKSKWLALYVLGIMVLIQQIEGNIISPKILGEYVGLHPLVIIFTLLAGGKLWGLTGLLLAVPLAAILKVLLRYAYLRLI